MEAPAGGNRRADDAGNELLRVPPLAALPQEAANHDQRQPAKECSPDADDT